MSKAQPGSGYGFTSSGYGFSLNTEKPFADAAPSQLFQQFQCIVVKEGDDYFLKTYKGVVDYSKSGFPWSPGSSPLTSFSWTEKQARLTDWAVYKNGTRTSGTATDGPRFEWFAGDGKVEIINGDYEGGSNSWLVTISMIDFLDNAGEHVEHRLIDAEMPFISVFPADDTEMTGRIQAPPYSSISGRTLYVEEGYVDDGSSVPQRIGYTYKKIAQIDWDSDLNSWQVTQYEYGPIDLRINWTETIGLAWDAAPDPSEFQIASENDFVNVSNYAWFESMWAIPGYTQNPASWWYNLVT
jgi:hypothetical protein